MFVLSDASLGATSVEYACESGGCFTLNKDFSCTSSSCRSSNTNAKEIFTNMQLKLDAYARLLGISGPRTDGVIDGDTLEVAKKAANWLKEQYIKLGETGWAQTAPLSQVPYYANPAGIPTFAAVSPLFHGQLQEGLKKFGDAFKAAGVDLNEALAYVKATPWRKYALYGVAGLGIVAGGMYVWHRRAMSKLTRSA